MSTRTHRPVNKFEIENGRWRIDPASASVEFRVPNFYGLQHVEGQFEHFEGTLDLHKEPAIELTIDADSLNTNNTQRDKHLRSADFFDVERHPHVRFVSDSADLDGEILIVRGPLHAAGETVPVDLDASLRRQGDELAIEATTLVDQRELGMTWSPLGIVRTPSKLIIHGRLVLDD
jgi:polyisoprenoid-binding protein YceI